MREILWILIMWMLQESLIKSSHVLILIEIAGALYPGYTEQFYYIEGLEHKLVKYMLDDAAQNSPMTKE